MTSSIYVIKRCSQHHLHWNTEIKDKTLESLFPVYKQELEKCIDHLMDLDSIPTFGTFNESVFESFTWKQIVFNNSSQILRSQIKRARNRRFKSYKKTYAKAKESGKFLKFVSKKFSDLNLKPIHKTRYFKKPDIRNVNILLNSNICNIKDSNHFDGFLKIVLPFRKESSKRYQTIKVPFKHHKQSLKFKDWKQKKSVRLSLDSKNKVSLTFFYEKEAPEKKTTGTNIGIDIGYKKLLSSSDGMFYGGSPLEYLYNYIARKKRESKKYKKTLRFKKDEINRYVNRFLKEHPDLKTLVVENLKEVKKESKFSHSFNNRLQYWSYRQVLEKLERSCQENGILLLKINPAYTSQTCSNCGMKDKKSRNGEHFHCLSCGYSDDADHNASANILQRGLLTTLTTKQESLSLSGVW